MILAVPVLVITLMYFMFENAPHRPGAQTPFMSGGGKSQWAIVARLYP